VKARAIATELEVHFICSPCAKNVKRQTPILVSESVAQFRVRVNEEESYRRGKMNEKNLHNGKGLRRSGWQ
jgi:hypothetical protein